MTHEYCLHVKWWQYKYQTGHSMPFGHTDSKFKVSKNEVLSLCTEQTLPKHPPLDDQSTLECPVKYKHCCLNKQTKND